MVDHYIPKTLGRLAKDAGVRSFQIITSLGANSSSRSFYLKVKGVVEKTIKDFEFQRVLIYRPSLLDGKEVSFVWVNLQCLLCFGSSFGQSPVLTCQPK